MILASILITAEAHWDQPLPPRVAQNIESFRRAHPGLEHRLFREPHIRDFLRQNYGRDVLAAYETLKPFAYKSDLARLCIMAHYGGAYADLSVYFLRGWRFEGGKLGVFRDFPWAAPWATANTIIFAPARHKGILKSIELICANVAGRYYGASVLCPTGPVAFGKALALSCEPDELIVGDSVFVTPKPSHAPLEPVRSHGFVLGGDVVAVKCKAGGGPLAQLGLAGGNEYAQMWNARNIYAP